MSTPRADAEGTAAPTTQPAAPDDRAVLRRRLRRAAPLLVLAAAAVVVAVIITSPPDRNLPLHPDSTAPAGTRALVEVLDGLRRPATVVTPDELDDAGGVILLLRDQLTRDERAGLIRQVEAGARVVVTDPSSPLAPQPIGAVPPLQPPLRRACEVPALARVGRVDPAGAMYEVPDGADGCYTLDEGSAWLVVQRRGRGEVVAAGGPGFLTNAVLRNHDNAVLAVHLLAPGDVGGPTIVRPVLRAAADEETQTLGDLVPDQVLVALWQVFIGFLVLVAWRARRLGRPLEDRAPVRLASSDLTAAVGALLGRHDGRAAALEHVTTHARRRLARRLDLPATVELDTLAEQIAARTPQDPATVARALSPPPPTSDAALLAAITTITDLEQAVLDQLATTLEETDVR